MPDGLPDVSLISYVFGQAPYEVRKQSQMTEMVPVFVQMRNFK